MLLNKVLSCAKQARLPMLGLTVIATLVVTQSNAQAAMTQLVTRDVNITLNPNLTTGPGGPTIPGSFDLDLNLDGQVDFNFVATNVSGFSSFDVLNNGNFASNNGFIADSDIGSGFALVSNLSLSDALTQRASYSAGGDQGNLQTFSFFSGTSGNFIGETGFVGLRFEDAAGKLLYGFAQVTTQSDSDASPYSLTIGQVGFFKPVPEPTTAAFMLLGAAGLGLVTKRRRQLARA